MLVQLLPTAGFQTSNCATVKVPKEFEMLEQESPDMA